ncbi:MAG: type II secretion system secretin GspD [Pseudomonadota bacterium]
MKSRFALAAAFYASTAPIAAWADMEAPQAARHVLNLNDVEMRALIEDVSMVTGNTFIVHPDVKGKVTVTSQTPLTTEDVFQVFLSTLRIHGYAAVPSGRDIYKIVPEQNAVGEAGIGGVGPNAFVTEIIKLNNFNALEAAQMVKPLVDAQGQVVANANSNTLVVVDYSSNLPKIRDIVAELDRDRTVVETISLKSVPAGEMEKILNDLQGSSEERRYGAAFSAIASETSNSIILRGDELSVQRALSVATQLDETDPVRDNLRILPLLNADADTIVPILESVGESMAGPDQRKATIQHHVPTNSLVLTADYETLITMERVVTELDVRRKQVLVEAIIVEVSDSAARELGLQFLLSGTDGNIPFASTNFSRSAPNLLALTGALTDTPFLADGGDDSTSSNPFTSAAIASLLGLQGLSFGFGGQSGDTLFGVVLNAVQDDTESNILSTPSVMTLDNSPAVLSVGQDIPITSGEVLGDANVNPFRTVERREVGVILNVTPRVGEGDAIRLDISQEVSSVAGTVGEITPDFILNTRNLETSVIADDGELIVLGGLIEEEDLTINERVPLLGDIPGFGRLFRSEGRSRAKTNLMVFIRPTVVRDSDAARNATARSYRYIRAQQILSGQRGDASLDRFVRDVLGDEPPR